MTREQDELAIRDLAARYADAVNRRDAQGMAAGFAPDGIIEKPGFGDPVQGIDRILKRYKRLQRERDFLAQMIHSGVVEIEEHSATARWWFSEIKNVHDTDQWLYMIGVYQDQLIRLDAGWRFARRSQTTVFEKDLSSEGLRTFQLPEFISMMTGSGPPRGSEK